MWAAELPVWSPPPVAAGAAVVAVGPESIPAIVAAMEAEGDLVAPRIARGCRCQAAWRDQRVLAYGWLSTGSEWISEVGLEIRPAPGEAYVWNCVTLAPHRRQGMFAALLIGIASRVQAEGCTRLWIATLDGNAESAVGYAGFAPALRIARSSVLGFGRLTAAPVPGAPEWLVERARGALSLGRRPLFGRARSRRH